MIDMEAYIGETLDIANAIYDELTDDERETVSSIDDVLSIHADRPVAEADGR